jgi:hypothetical protein
MCALIQMQRDCEFCWQKKLSINYQTFKFVSLHGACSISPVFLLIVGAVGI